MALRIEEDRIDMYADNIIRGYATREIVRFGKNRMTAWEFAQKVKKGFTYEQVFSGWLCHGYWIPDPELKKLLGDALAEMRAEGFLDEVERLI